MFADRDSRGYPLAARRGQKAYGAKCIGVVNSPETIQDRRGRKVLLDAERWQHIVSAHPEIETYTGEIRRAVESPTSVIAGREPDEEWLYLEGAGPSRWLKVVVVFDSKDQGRIITSFARRRKP